MSKNYTFFFKDGYFVTFPLTKDEYFGVKNAIINKLECVLLDDYVIMLSDLRYVAKQQEPTQTQSATPEDLEQDVYEYIKEFDRSMKDGEVQERY